MNLRCLCDIFTPPLAAPAIAAGPTVSPGDDDDMDDNDDDEDDDMASIFLFRPLAILFNWIDVVICCDKTCINASLHVRDDPVTLITDSVKGMRDTLVMKVIADHTS